MISNGVNSELDTYKLKLKTFFVKFTTEKFNLYGSKSKLNRCRIENDIDVNLNTKKIGFEN